jgi:hypothetical protein
MDTVTFIYTGRRLNAKNTLSYVWLDESGAERWFDKLVGRSIGAAYSVEATEDRCSVDPATLAYLSSVESEVGADQVLQWIAADRADSTRKEMLARDKRAARDDDAFTTMCAPLRDQYKKAIGHSRKAAMLAALIEEVTRY